jgi:hypothetical protein
MSNKSNFQGFTQHRKTDVVADARAFIKDTSYAHSIPSTGHITALIAEVEAKEKQVSEMQAYGCFIPDKDSGVRCSVADQNTALLKRCEEAEVLLELCLTEMPVINQYGLEGQRLAAEDTFVGQSIIQALSQKGQSDDN